MNKISIALLFCLTTLIAEPPTLSVEQQVELEVAMEKEKSCLARAIHEESRGESVIGQLAVRDTIRNRARSKKMSLCSVILQKGQFQWSGRLKHLHATREMRDRLKKLERLPAVLPEGYEFFWHKRLKPIWSVKMRKVVIGNHSFGMNIKEKS